jgi:hypothetical protein
MFIGVHSFEEKYLIIGYGNFILVEREMIPFRMDRMEVLNYYIYTFWNIVIWGSMISAFVGHPWTW